VVAAGERPLRLSGWRSPSLPPLTVVVLGDAVLAAGGGPDDAGLCLHGVLVVTGSLTVQTPALVEGSLGAGALQVAAPLVVQLAAGWRDAPPPGALLAWLLPQ
jgi:hypothetical protein